MKLWALSDLHLGYAKNREALEAVPAHPDDWLILGGDLGETVEHLVFAYTTLHNKFAKLIWVPGNHELWTVKGAGNDLRGVAKYELLVSVCQELGILTPEDPFPLWPGPGPATLICPLFIGFDYTMAPDGLTPDEARAWAREEGIVSRDESVLHPDPWPSRQAWCADRLARTSARLDALPSDARTVLINHWPLRRDLVRLYRIPRFIPWCGTRHTEDWHTRYNADVVVYGHLHMRATDWRHGVRFEEVAAGYPRHWRRPWGEYLREILPGSATPPASGFGGPHWHR